MEYLGSFAKLVNFFNVALQAPSAEEQAAWLYLASLSICISVKGRASHNHAMGFEQPFQSIYLLGGMGFLNRLPRDCGDQKSPADRR